VTWHDLADLLLRVAGLGLASGAVVQVAKFHMRLVLELGRRFPAEGTPLRGLWRSGVRTLAVVVGALLGLLDVWPAWAGWQAAWGPLLGLVAGVLSFALYDSALSLVDGAPGVLLGALSKRLGGGAARPGRRTTNDLDTRPMPSVGDPEEDP
jgi:hypothetical protein